MRLRLPRIATCLIALALPLTAGAQDATAALQGIAAHAEIHGVATQTLTDTAFLTGQTGTPATVAGLLRLPEGKGPFPAAVLLHGSSGMGSNIDAWERQLNAMGIATFSLDALTGRGLRKLGDNQGAVGRLNFILDTYGALDVLAKDDRIDPARIVLIGFSRGGQAALYAALDRFNERWNTSGARYAAYLPFYPNCVTAYRDETKVGAAPIRIFHGAADDYNPAAVCESYAARLKSAGADVEMITYPGAHHGFDSPTLFGRTVVAKGAQTARNCKLEENAQGIVMNLETQAPFDYDDACVETDPHFGGDAQAAEAAHEAVAAFLTAQFGL